MSKRRTGLQKTISAIFDGVPIPKNDDTEQSSGAPAPERPDYASGKPFAPSHFTATIPEPEKPSALQLKAPPAKETKATVVVKTPGLSQWQQSLEQIKAKLFAPKPGVSASRQKTMAVLVPVLFVVFICGLVWVFGTSSRKPSRLRKPGQMKAVVASGSEITWQIPALWPKTLRDPMQFGSSATTQAGTSRPIVKGIVYSKDDPSALVGAQIVRQGDEVLGATVIKINEDSVEFEMNGKRWTQKVQP